MATEEEVHVDDIGTKFVIEFRDKGKILNIENATVMKTIFNKTKAKNTKTVVQDADFYTDGKDGRTVYISVEGDIDVDGLWEIQGYVDLPDGKWYSSKDSFEVYPNIAKAV
jgi:hypothetical protein